MFLCAGRLSRLDVKNGWLTKQSFKARFALRRCIESGNKVIPFFFIECENCPIRQPFFGFAECRFKNELANGFLSGRRCCLQCLFSRLAEAKIKFLRSC